jgi:uncharacterized protein (DUF983 family)
MGSDPYASLDPRGPDPADPPRFPEVGASRALLRGLRKRCPRCGGGDLFVTWFRPVATCPRCELRLAKEEGAFLGAMTINYAVAMGAWLIFLVVAIAMTVPDVPVVPLLLISAVILIGVPLWFYPRSKTLWAAIEFLVLRSDPDYRSPVVRDARRRELE